MRRAALVGAASVLVVGALLGARAVGTPINTCVTATPGIYVDLNNARSPETIRHERDAVAAGQPRILHLDRKDADLHRSQSLKGIAKVPGDDLDEYPPAATAEGGTGADVRPIPSSDNRSSGSTMGAQLRPYCDGQAFILEP